MYFIPTRTYGNSWIYALKKYFLAIVNFTQAKDGLYVHNFNFASFFRNINEFCHVLKQLPSFDDERLSSSSSGSSSSSTSSTSTNSKSKSGNPTTGIQSIAKSKESRNKNGVAPHPAEGNKRGKISKKYYNI